MTDRTDPADSDDGTMSIMDGSLLDRARAGDGSAFGDLISPYRRELHLHCYRLLGSLVDADDLLQETITAAWRGLTGFGEHSSLRTWLYRIATNRCLNAVRDAGRRPRTQPIPPFVPPAPTQRGEIDWLQPYPDSWLDHLGDSAPGPAARLEQHETVELAFIVALQRLPPRQAAALVLIDVLGFALSETADLLDTTAVAIKAAIQRARGSLRAERHRPDGGPGSDAERQLAQRFAVRLADGDITGLVALLTDDAWLSMPPAPHEYFGPTAIGQFLQVSTDWRKDQPLVMQATRANRQPAFESSLAENGQRNARSAGILVLTMRNDRISRITRFLDDGLAARIRRSAVPHPDARLGQRAEVDGQVHYEW